MFELMIISILILQLYVFLFFYLFLVNFVFYFFFSSRRRHTRWNCDWSSDVCSSDLGFCQLPELPPLPSDLELGRGEHLRPRRLVLQRGCLPGDEGRSGGLPLPPLQIGRASCRERV